MARELTLYWGCGGLSSESVREISSASGSVVRANVSVATAASSHPHVSLAHAVLLIGITRRQFVFDEVHYVPAARQMLEPVHASTDAQSDASPLRSKLIAVSIRIFGDRALGWRYPSVLFGALAVVAI